MGRREVIVIPTKSDRSIGRGMNEKECRKSTDMYIPVRGGDVGEERRGGMRVYPGMDGRRFL